jgi:uncharacterized protein
MHFEDLSFMADSDTVGAFTEVTVGNEMGEDADVYTLRDGKIVRAQLYTDAAMMDRVPASAFPRQTVAASAKARSTHSS